MMVECSKVQMQYLILNICAILKVLTENLLSYLPESIGELTELSVLNVDRNRLTLLTNRIGNCEGGFLISTSLINCVASYFSNDFKINSSLNNTKYFKLFV